MISGYSNQQNSLLKKEKKLLSLPFSGLANKLNDLEELFDIPGRYRCSYVGARLDRALIGNVDHYQQFTEVPHEPFITTGRLYSQMYLLFYTNYFLATILCFLLNKINSVNMKYKKTQKRVE